MSTAAPANASATPTGVPAGQSPALYVGDLDKEVTEAQLFNTFSPFGSVASMRICRDAITRKSLGYAYVNFQTVAEAANAMRELNYTRLRDRPLRIMWVQRDPSVRRSATGNVFVKNLDPSVDSRVLSENFSLFGNVLSCRVVTDDAGKSKGYGFVQFDTEEAAKKAMDGLNGAEIGGRPVYVGPFKRRDSRGASTEFTNLYVRGLPLSWGEEKLKGLFAPHGAITSALIVRDAASGRSKGVAFVNFSKPEEAEAALGALNDTPLEDDEEPEAEESEGEAKKEEGAAAAAPKEGDAAPAVDGNSKPAEAASASSSSESEAAAAPAAEGEAKPAADADAAVPAAAAAAAAASEAKDVEAKDGEAAAEAPTTDAPAPAGDSVDAAAAAPAAEGSSKPEDAHAPAAPTTADAAAVGPKEGDAAPAPAAPAAPKAPVKTLHRLFVARFQPKSERSRDLAAKFREAARGKGAAGGGAGGDDASGKNACNLYVKNLEERVDDDELRSKFGSFGPITSAKVMRDSTTGVSKGFGFVSYATPEDAQRALAEANKTLWHGRPLYVSLAQPKAVRQEQLNRLRAQAAMRAQQSGGYLGAPGAGAAGGGGVGAGAGRGGGAVPGAGGMGGAYGGAMGMGAAGVGAGGMGMMMMPGAVNVGAGGYGGVGGTPANAAAAQLMAYQQQYTLQVIQAVQSGAITMGQAQALLTQMNALMAGAPGAGTATAPATARSVAGGSGAASGVPTTNRSVAVPASVAAVTGGAAAAPAAAARPASAVPAAGAAARPGVAAGPQQQGPGAPAAAAARPGMMAGPPGMGPRGPMRAPMQQQQGMPAGGARPAMQPQPMVGGPRPLYAGALGGAPQPQQQPQQQQQPMAAGPRPVAAAGPAPTPAQAAAARQQADQAFLATLSRASPDQQRNMLGERLYPRVAELDKGAGRAGKLTGMLLELPVGEVLELLSSRDALAAKVEEANAVLAEHAAVAQARR